MLQPLGVRLRYIASGSPLTPGKYVVLDINRKHFFALTHVEGYAIVIDGDRRAQIQLSELCDISSSSKHYVFKLTAGLASPESLQAYPYTVTGGALSKPIYVTAMKKCICGHSKLSPSHLIEASVFGLDGPMEVQVQTMRCTHYSCRITFGPNFYTMAGSKINTADVADLTDALFVSAKRGFTLNYLKYHTQLEFRAFASSRAIADIYGSVFGNDVDESEQFRKMHADAIMYWNALNEFEPLGLHKDTASCRFEK